jgi:hypothetical protein
MLDKSLPYYNVLMKRQHEVFFSEVRLPNDFSFTKYIPGDEIYWADIEKSVGEFNHIQEGIKYFRDTYMSFIRDISNRVIFINTLNNEKSELLQPGGIIPAASEICLFTGLRSNRNFKVWD